MMIASPPISEFDLFLRIWDQNKLAPSVAKHLLKLQFGEEERARIAELTAKNRDAVISPSELDELDRFVRVGGILSVLQSRARKALQGNREKA